MAPKNTSLNKAKAAKYDEFYTQLADIEKELRHYRPRFEGKVVLCNCDDPVESNFYAYFHQNFHALGLKKLVTTHFHRAKPTYKLEYTGGKRAKQTPLKANGDFRSPECMALLREADIIVTNPPFSLFREYVARLVEQDKDFLIIGNMNAIEYKEIRPLFLGGKIWLGYKQSGGMTFMTPEGEPKHMGFAVWFTNITHGRLNEKLILHKFYHAAEHPTYDNYDAIEVAKVKNIPADYDGEMGVPISFLTKHNPGQFDLVGFDDDLIGNRFYVNGKRKYTRLVIKHKKETEHGN